MDKIFINPDKKYVNRDFDVWKFSLWGRWSPAYNKN